MYSIYLLAYTEKLATRRRVTRRGTQRNESPVDENEEGLTHNSGKDNYIYPQIYRVRILFIDVCIQVHTSVQPYLTCTICHSIADESTSATIASVSKSQLEPA